MLCVMCVWKLLVLCNCVVCLCCVSVMIFLMERGWVLKWMGLLLVEKEMLV